MPREGGTAAAAAGHTKLLLCVTQYTILYATVGSKRHQKHRRTRGEIEGDTRGRREGTRGTQETPEAPKGTAEEPRETPRV